MRDWGIPLGRRFRALKLWFLIREQGVDGAAGAAAARHRRTRRWLADAGRGDAAAGGCSRPVPLQTVCVRHEPPGSTARRSTGTRSGWCDRVNRSGAAYLTPAVLDGRWMVRVSIGAEPTEREHVEQLWTAMRAEAER